MGKGSNAPGKPQIQYEALKEVISLIRREGVEGEAEQKTWGVEELPDAAQSSQVL